MATTVDVTERPFSWAEQFSPSVTSRQIWFDVVCGILLPIVCLYFDPIVFRSLAGGALVGPYAVGAATAIGLGMISLSVWLIVGRPSALLAGLLAGGTSFASLLGLILLPISLLTSVLGIGLLGLSPFATAFVMYRNAVRAFHQSRLSQLLRGAVALIGMVIACGLPLIAQRYVTSEVRQGIEMVQSSDLEEAARGVSKLKRFVLLVNFDQLALASDAEQDQQRKERLAAAFKELTGEEASLRVDRLED